MSTIRNYAAEDATVIFGTVFDESMEDQLRVTVVATGLGVKSVARRQPELRRVETVAMGLRTGTDGYIVDSASSADSNAMPAIMHGRGARNAAVEAMTSSGMDKYDIPAFLRKQAD